MKPGQLVLYHRLIQTGNAKSTARRPSGTRGVRPMQSRIVVIERTPDATWLLRPNPKVGLLRFASKDEPLWPGPGR